MATIDRRGADLSQTDPAVATDPNPGLAIKAPVRVATTGNIALSGLQAIDGIVVASSDRVLVKNQTDATTNGIYDAASGNWTRSIDANNSSQWAHGTQVAVTSGTVNAGIAYRVTTNDPIVLGTSSLTFSSVTASIIVGTSSILNGSSTNTSYGILFNENGLLGDSNVTSALTAQGITGNALTISSNPAPLPPWGSEVNAGGAFAPILQLATGNEGETILALASFGTNSTSTIVLSKTRGTAAAPTALKNGDVIAALEAEGYGATKTTAATALLTYRAAEDWTDTAHGTSFDLVLQANGTAYPTDAVRVMTIDGSGGMLFPLAVVGGSKGTGTINATGLYQAGTQVATLGANTFVAGQTLTLNQNGETQYTINNTNAGANADASFFASNGTGAMIVGVGSTGNTVASSLYQNRGFLFSTAGATGLVIDARGASHPIIFATNDIERMRIAGGGFVGIGDNNPQYLVSITGNITGGQLGLSSASDGIVQIVGADSHRAGVEAIAFAQQAVLRGTRADGTAASKSALAGADEAILNFSANGWDGASYVNGGAFIFWSSQAWTSGAHAGTYGTVYTTPTNTQAVAEAVRFQPSGGVSIGATTDPAIGGLLINGQFYGPNIATTASAANAFIDTGTTPVGQIKRSTSSLIYKRDVEPLDPAIALKLLHGAKPIWYRSKCAADNAAWSFYGLGAEDVAAIDPRLVHYGYQDDDFETFEVDAILPSGQVIKLKECRVKAGAALKPDGVQYERLVPHLVTGWQDHEARIAALEARTH